MAALALGSDESAMDAQGALTSHARIALQGSVSRDRTQSWWDVLPVLPKCGKPCWVSTLSGWQMTILRTCAVSMTYTSSMVSKQ